MGINLMSIPFYRYPQDDVSHIYVALNLRATGNPRKSAQGGITGLGGQNEQK